MKITELNKILLEKFKKTKVIFWYDNEGNFEQNLDKLDLPNIEIRKIENNEFYLKYHIEKELSKDDKILLYHKGIEPKLEENWLADILLYSETFYADYKYLIKEELGVDFPGFNEIYIDFKPFFKSQKRISKLGKLIKNHKDKTEFILAMIAVSINSPSHNIEDILLYILNDSLEEEDNEKLKQLSKYNLDIHFWAIVSRYFNLKNDEINLLKLLSIIISAHIAFNADNEKINQALSEHLYFKNFDKGLHISNYFVDEWKNNNKFKKSYFEASRIIENLLPIEEIFKDVDLKTLSEITALEYFDNLILKKLIEENLDSNIDEYLNIISKRKNTFWWDKFRFTYEAIEYYLKFIKELKINTNFENKSSGLSTIYIENTYLIDTFYRKFIFSYKKGNIDILKTLFDDLERKYFNFNNRFLSLWDNNLKINSSPKQINFYEKNIKPFVRRNEKIFVIVSDALRYEIGMELFDKLKNSFYRSEITIDYMFGNIPTITPVGMASLLPHDKIELNAEGKAFIDNKSVATTNAKEEILQKYSANAIAIVEDKFMALTTSEGQSFFKGKNVIYIYQNIIDKVGDDNTTERNVFEAAEQCIENIHKMISKIISFNGNNIFITADHGFIYKESDIDDYLKIEFPFDKSNFILKPRYSLGNNLSEIDSCHFFESNEDTQYKRDNLLVPKGFSRFSPTTGANKKFLHGGVAPQEIILPLIRFKYTKQKSKKPVDIELVHPTRRVITSNKPRFQILQLEPISNDVVSFEANVAIYDDDKKISNNLTLNFESSSDKSEDRIYEFKLNLKPMEFDKNKTYKFKVFKDNILIKEYDFNIRILISNDFF